jgi:hypothetical protein
MINCPNNILSYFIKDIKDATEVAFYKQINLNNDNNDIKIFYKDKIIYHIKDNYIHNYIHNIIKYGYYKYIKKTNIDSNYISNFKRLYYKNNNPNCITFDFTYKQYLIKTKLRYFINTKYLLYVYIIYSNCYKYIKKINDNTPMNKFFLSHILIPNKYELQYYCKFFNLY